MKAIDLTIEEKLRLLTAANEWQTESISGKLKVISMADGPSGLRKSLDPNIDSEEAVPATAMPTISVLANSWDEDAAFLDGKTIADDCIENNIDILLAPGVNMKRTPLCGRNFEYFSEDPLLAGRMAKAYINGVQSKGIGTSLKHLAANNREFDRFFQSSEIDERSFHEIYLKAFEIAISAQPYTVMCSYNPINGIYASENRKLLKHILRDTFGYQGAVISDWKAVHNRYKALKATLDIEMPHKANSYGVLKDAYEKALISDEEIDFCVNNILQLIEKTTHKKQVDTTRSQRHENARYIASQGIVLLKNDNDILPLKKEKISIAGSMAQNPTIGGGGSAYVTSAYHQTNLAELLSARLPLSDIQYVNDFKNRGNYNFHLRAVTEAAYHSDVTVLCVGDTEDDETERRDRISIRLSPAQERLIIETAKANKNTVVLIYAGSAVDMSLWIDLVQAVVYVGFAGEGVNEALADIMSGLISPSGKLSETFPLTIEETFTKERSGNGYWERYNDSVFVGYRYYDTEKTKVLFPFGFGLSYASFEYSNLKIQKQSETDYTVSYSITNTSDVDAKEISQLYVRDVFSMVSRPLKELKAFHKDLIHAHETKEVTLTLDSNAFAYYSVELDRWYVENGDYEIFVGPSSRNLPLSAKISVNLPDETQFSTK